MNDIRRILVAVKNPDAARQPGADKALRIARSLGADVEFFHALSTPAFLELEPLTGRSIAELRREALGLRQQRLGKLVAKARRLGVKATATTEWDYPPHEAIVRRAIHGRVDLVVAECHAGRRSAAWLLQLTDWELLRTSPMPVLLLRNTKPWRRGRVLAAVDPSHAHAKPSDLDDRIVAQGRALAQKLRGELHVMHANYPAIGGFLVGDPAIDAAALAASFEQQKSTDRAAYQAFAKRSRIPTARRLLRDGDPAIAIPAAARSLRADVVVMGAVSRSGLKRLFIGHTAERVLGDLPCDVLVVKPAQFRKRVPEKPRGIRVIPTQPLLPLPF
jgi:universal stress protein E